MCVVTIEEYANSNKGFYSNSTSGFSESYIYCGMMSIIYGAVESSNQMKMRCLLA